MDAFSSSGSQRTALPEQPPLPQDRPPLCIHFSWVRKILLSFWVMDPLCSLALCLDCEGAILAKQYSVVVSRKRRFLH